MSHYASRTSLVVRSDTGLNEISALKFIDEKLI